MRSGWADRSASYRSRLIGAGKSGKLTGKPLTAEETQRYWEGGGDLRAGRSHVTRPSWAAPKDATDREAVGLGTDKSYREVQRWFHRRTSRGGPPKWLPHDDNVFSAHAAAILSQIPRDPTHWVLIEWRFRADQSSSMTIHLDRGYPVKVQIPDRSVAHEIGQLLQNYTVTASSKGEERRMAPYWERPDGEGIVVKTRGS